MSLYFNNLYYEQEQNKHMCDFVQAFNDLLKASKDLQNAAMFF